MHQTALTLDAIEHRMELHRQASQDALTGLANRAWFMRQLEARSAGYDGTATAVLFLDLDGFKAVNDSYGHAAGDELLTVVAARISAELPADCLVGRLGGDEFAMLVPVADGAGASRLLADRIEAAIRVPVPLRCGAVVSVGASVGVQVVHGRFDPDQALHAADSAMYDVKSSHRASRSALA
jgi:diguanylate cyclase (GGDEF)-like protein